MMNRDIINQLETTARRAKKAGIALPNTGRSAEASTKSIDCWLVAQASDITNLFHNEVISLTFENKGGWPADWRTSGIGRATAIISDILDRLTLA